MTFPLLVWVLTLLFFSDSCGVGSSITRNLALNDAPHQTRRWFPGAKRRSLANQTNWTGAPAEEPGWRRLGGGVGAG